MNRCHDVHGGAPPCADRTSVDRSPRNHRAPKVARRRRNPRAPKRSHAAVMLHHRRRVANPSSPSMPRPPSTTIDHHPTTVDHHQPPPDHRQPSSDHRQPSLTLPHPRPSIVRARYHRPNTVSPRPNHPRQPSSTLAAMAGPQHAMAERGVARGPGAQYSENS